MTAAQGGELPGWLRWYPGAVLKISADGVVLASNGALDRHLARPVVGQAFDDLLDEGPSRAKWHRMLAATPEAASAAWELVLCGAGGSRDPQRFSLLRDDGAPSLWLVEHPADPRLEGVRAAVAETNTALVETQRELVRERSRVAMAMRELERSNRALDEFAHVVSHDLRAPLRSIGNYAKWIGEDAGPSLAGPAAGHLSLLREQVVRMQRMTQGLLDYARAGRYHAVPEQVDLDALVREVVAMVAPPATATVTTAGVLPAVFTVRAPLQQVLLNLVANAIAHAGDRVHVTISARDVGRQIEVSVADDGPGVPLPLRDRVWDLFHTGTGSAMGGGAGIGLAVVKRLAEDLGGRAWVAESGDSGADFRFTWPKEPKTGS